MNKPAANIESDRQAYELLMSEVNARLFAIKEIIKRLDRVHPQIIYETCGSQSRLCCENIALACLVAHSTIHEASKPDIRTAYAPGVIMAMLYSLHEDFYPKPRTSDRTPDGWYLGDDPDALASFLSRENLVKLWNSLGDLLHKGSLKSILADRKKIA